MQQNTNADLEQQLQACKTELAELARAVETERTARQQTEQAAQQELYQQATNILESITDAFFAIDLDWRFTYVNSQAQRLMQKTRDELLGQNMWDVYPEAVGTTFDHEYHRAMREKISVRLEELCLPLNNWFDVQIYPARNGLSVYFRDITEHKQTEATVYQREQEFRALAENSPDIIARFDRQLRHLYINTAVEKATGLPPQSFIGKTNRELGMSQALCTYWEENFQQVFTTGQECTFEFDFLTPDGTRRYYQSRVVPEFALDGSVESILGVSRDVTDFKQTEKALRESQQLLQAILDTTPTNIYVKDLQGRYILVNRCCCEGALSLRGEQMIGKTDYDIWPREIADIFRASDQAVLEAATPLNLEEVLPKADELHTFITTKFPLYDSSGALYAVCSISTDITERKQAEEALYQREQEFRALAENSPDIISRIDKQLRHLYVNAAIESVTGLSSQAFIGKTHRDLGMPEDLYNYWQENLRQVFITAQERTVDFDFLTPDGTTRNYQSRLVPEFALDGSVESILGVARDVTDFKQTEAALRESQEQFRQLAENIDAVFWVFSVDEQKTLYISPAYEKIWGRSSQPLYENSRNWMDTIYPEDRTYVATMYERLNQGEFIEEVYRIVKPDGSVRWINDRAFPVYDAQGRLYRTAGIAEDITERKLTEAALRESEQKYRSLVETSQGVIWSINTEGRLTFVNQAVRQMCGYEPEEMIGRHCSELVTLEQAQKDTGILQRILAGQSVFQYEAECLHKDRTPFWVRCNMIRLRDDTGNVLGTTGTAVDISDRKRAEEQLKASLQEKEALLKEVHHRVKNNLQVISSLLDLQSQQIQDPMALEAFRESRNRVKSMAIIHEKLYQSENLAKINLADYIEILTSYLLQTYAINPNNITLQLTVDEIFLNLDRVIPCGLIINELVSNALKHGFPVTTKGSIWVELNSVSLESSEEQAHLFTLVVGNDGMKLQDPQNLFYAKSLGMQLVNILVKQLGVHIEISQNRGTEFKIRFSNLGDRT
ncbi:MAG TPA: PAS domain S-box protein [Coleofasciculaceae cyanobacterium]|jgi:PAS domain S-box-containing protein